MKPRFHQGVPKKCTHSQIIEHIHILCPKQNSFRFSCYYKSKARTQNDALAAMMRLLSGLPRRLGLENSRPFVPLGGHREGPSLGRKSESSLHMHRWINLKIGMMTFQNGLQWFEHVLFDVVLTPLGI